MKNRDEQVIWGGLTLEIPATLEEELTGRLAMHSLGAESNAAGPEETIQLKIYLESPQQAEEVAGHVRKLLLEFGLEAEDCALRVDPVTDGHWVERYQSQLVPFELGSRFTVYPSGKADKMLDKHGIVLVPGQAFGTGEHPTTQLCVEQLECNVRAGQAWCDLGCGTGILSIIARRCGAERVLALDNDPTAVLVAREVMAANGELDAIQLQEGTAMTPHAGLMDGVVVNISAEYLVDAALTISDLLRSSGILIASGFMGENAGRVEAAFNAVGLTTLDQFDREPWAAILMQRNG
jgi:ribosomal protein L11 methyltransferase